MNEATVQAAIRLEASRLGIHLWRNNVGALKDETGRYIRFGLANDSNAVNHRIKSGDLIGIRSGGIFVSREIKPLGWKFSGTEREWAQQRWIELVNAAGGDAAFCTGEGSFR